MPDQEPGSNLQDFIEIREPTVNYEEHQKAEPLQIDVDLTNFKKFPRVDDSVTYKKEGRDYRGDIKVDPHVNLPDYSGPFKPDLRFSDFSKEQLVKILSMSNEYYVLVVAGWVSEVGERYGREVMLDVQSGAWNDFVLPQVRRIVGEWMDIPGIDAEAIAADLQRDVAAAPGTSTGMVSYNPFRPDDPIWVELSKEQLVKLALGSHEYFLQVIEAWAAQIVMRYGLDVMFDIQWELWSDKVLPETRAIKIRWMNITGNDVAAFMKDLQMDATSFPGKAFEVTYEMPEKDVGIMTFNRCCAPAQWEALGRPDILEKGCHVTCPQGIIDTAKMYNPNMKVDILAIPPRIDTGDVCCKWRLSMRSEDDPEYVPPVDIEIGSRPSGG